MLAGSLLEIRALAGRAAVSPDKIARFHEIRRIADHCLTMSSAISVRERDGFDGLVFMWQAAGESQKRLMRDNLDAEGLDHRWLDEAPR
jgi:hypothetical protein